MIAYEYKYRRRAIVGAVGFPVAIGILLVWALPASTRELPALLGFSAFVGVCFVGFLWFTLFLLNTYRCTEDGIEQRGPLPGVRKYLCWADIRACRRFTYEPRLEARQGYILVGKDGTKITVMDALPIWPKIAEHLECIPSEPHPFLARLVLRAFRAA